MKSLRAGRPSTSTRLPMPHFDCDKIQYEGPFLPEIPLGLQALPTPTKTRRRQAHAGAPALARPLNWHVMRNAPRRPLRAGGTAPVCLGSDGSGFGRQRAQAGRRLLRVPREDRYRILLLARPRHRAPSSTTFPPPTGRSTKSVAKLKDKQAETGVRLLWGHRLPLRPPPLRPRGRPPRPTRGSYAYAAAPGWKKGARMQQGTRRSRLHLLGADAKATPPCSIPT